MTGSRGCRIVGRRDLGAVRDQRAARAKEPHVWSAEAEGALRGAGWYPGRSVETTAWRVRLEADGFRIHAAAEEFLREFGGLRAASRAWSGWGWCGYAAVAGGAYAAPCREEGL
ncbi:SUKH-3 domain-containing protein [Streptomyces nojiriensis]|uniref:SUKH-3 domain-containing protein n=1 Tax=Streptomyces nojiriensis TaxID=66374 RepID=UPI0036DF3BF3